MLQLSAKDVIKHKSELGRLIGAPPVVLQELTICVAVVVLELEGSDALVLTSHVVHGAVGPGLDFDLTC